MFCFVLCFLFGWMYWIWNYREGRGAFLVWGFFCEWGFNLGLEIWGIFFLWILIFWGLELKLRWGLGTENWNMHARSGLDQDMVIVAAVLRTWAFDCSMTNTTVCENLLMTVSHGLKSQHHSLTWEVVRHINLDISLRHIKLDILDWY